MTLNGEVVRTHKNDNKNMTSIRNSSIITFSEEGIKNITREYAELLAPNGHDSSKCVPCDGGPMTKNLIKLQMCVKIL